jgi:hypothetical protein
MSLLTAASPALLLESDPQATIAQARSVPTTVTTALRRESGALFERFQSASMVVNLSFRIGKLVEASPAISGCQGKVLPFTMVASAEVVEIRRDGDMLPSS